MKKEKTRQIMNTVTHVLLAVDIALTVKSIVDDIRRMKAEKQKEDEEKPNLFLMHDPTDRELRNVLAQLIQETFPGIEDSDIQIDVYEDRKPSARITFSMTKNCAFDTYAIRCTVADLKGSAPDTAWRSTCPKLTVEWADDIVKEVLEITDLTLEIGDEDL